MIRRAGGGVVESNTRERVSVAVEGRGIEKVEKVNGDERRSEERME